MSHSPSANSPGRSGTARSFFDALGDISASTFAGWYTVVSLTLLMVASLANLSIDLDTVFLVPALAGLTAVFVKAWRSRDRGESPAAPTGRQSTGRTS